MNLLFTVIKLLIPLKNSIFFGYHLPLPFKVVFINMNIGKHFLDCKLFSNSIDYFYYRMTTDTSNINFQLASDFINYTNRSVFLTGKAGTGKTTFLKHIKQQSIKQMAVVAPTGVAAINAGGVTIHSFFQLPFSPFIPETHGFKHDIGLDKHQLISRLKIATERRKIFQQLELLVIDEISMVRADVLDAIDTVLQYFRNDFSLILILSVLN